MTERKLFYPERFKTASQYYTTGRPTYPKLLSRRVAELVGLTRDGGVLDLGTGPGFLAIDFAPRARAVTAVDPSPEMLAAARANAARADVSIQFVQGSSYELGPHLGRFHLVTIGRAFHWMDRVETIRSLDALLDRGGAVALFGETYPEVPANAWHKEFQALIDKYSTEDPARPQIREAVKNEAVLLDSAFSHLERISVLEQRATPVERFVDRALSFAATWHGRPGSREEDLAVEVRRAIAKHADADGIVREVLEGHALVARRPREVASD
ncbi:class I SAM-dependent methyltransferase [Sorangium sp. So ce385]|uniref:class I SAM-dependent methyltransferase n=1 Tax=Sorangium sp. So ce385 TaxID=3133308 RepID=UPI003F5B8E68